MNAEKPDAVRLAEELLMPYVDNFHEVCEAASTELLFLYKELETERLLRGSLEIKLETGI